MVSLAAAQSKAAMRAENKAIKFAAPVAENP
jgi:hypothetical protein